MDYLIAVILSILFLMGTFWFWENFLDIADALWRRREERRRKTKEEHGKRF